MRSGAGIASVLPVTEKAWQQTILEAAQALGWICFHPFDSRKSEPGFPDLTCAKEGRLLFLEVKTERGKVSPAQERWLALLNTVPGIRAYVVRPSDWDAIELALREARDTADEEPAVASGGG